MILEWRIKVQDFFGLLKNENSKYMEIALFFFIALWLLLVSTMVISIEFLISQSRILI